NPADAEIAEGCGVVGRGRNVEFVDVGRGGMPTSPRDFSSVSTITADWVDLPETTESARLQNIAFARALLEWSCGL
ncbi:MAG: hypothetical protein SVX43_22810, partial [Cyanobacteriota bacterium]|nr:hypothetical protein [Cyanobacteriota bacterium]